MAREIDLSKPLSKKTIAYLRSTRPLGVVDRLIELAKGPNDEPEADATADADADADTTAEADADAKAAKPDPNGEMKEGDDPSDFNVGPVQAHLLTASEEESARVLEAEREGKARKNILEG